MNVPLEKSKNIPTHLSCIGFVQQVSILFIYGNGGRGAILVQGAVGSRIPCLNNDEHAEICKERRSATLNQSALAEGFLNRLDKVLFVFPNTFQHSFPTLSFELSAGRKKHK